MPRLSSLLLVAASLSSPGLAACARDAKPLASVEGVAPGVTTLRLANDLDGSRELEHLVITVDDETVQLASLPPSGGRSVTLARLHLAPGAHALSVRATARRRGESAVVVGQQPFWVTLAPASIGVRLHEGGAEADASPVALELSMVGGRTSHPPRPRSTSGSSIATLDDACQALRPIPGAVCRAAKDLEDAARRNDVTAALCLHDSLDEMRRLAGIAETADAESRELAEARVGLVARLAERCAGTLAPVLEDGVTVTRVEP